jgi:hypothetical protein
MTITHERLVPANCAHCDGWPTEAKHRAGWFIMHKQGCWLFQVGATFVPYEMVASWNHRGMTSAEAGEPLHERIQAVYTRQGRAAVCGTPDDLHNCDQMACSSIEHVLARVPHIVDEKPCATCDGEPRGVLIDVVSGKPVKPLERTYGAEWRPCPDCGERKAVVEGNCGLRKLLSLLRENKLGQFCRDLNRAIALLSQEGLSDEQREACDAGATALLKTGGGTVDEQLVQWAAYNTLRQLANEGKP